MITVKDFLTFLFQQRPQDNAARLSLYNYIKNFTTPDQEFNPSVVKNFYRWAFHFEHWSSNHSEQNETLAEEIQILIEQYLDVAALEKKIIPNPLLAEKFRMSSQFQMLKIERTLDLFEMCEQHLRALSGPQDHLKVLSLNESSVLGLRMDPEKRLRVYEFGPQAMIQNGRLEPLMALTQLKYGANLELYPNCIQMLQLGPAHFARFEMAQGKASGAILRGHTMNRVENFQNIALKDKPAIFFALKRMEKHFIDRTTDSFYKELQSLLEQSMKLFEQKHPQAKDYGVEALSRAQTAIETIYPDDKVLSLLLKELATLVTQTREKSWPNQSLNQSLSHPSNQTPDPQRSPFV